MSNYSSLGFKEAAKNHILIYDHENLIAEVKDLYLINAKFKPDNDFVICEEYPLPLFWRQYANHEDPERSAGIIISMNAELVDESVVIDVKSRNGSGSIESSYLVKIYYNSVIESYVYLFSAHLEIISDWEVTFNPTHGEVEYLNFYPKNTFVKNDQVQKKYDLFLYESKTNVLALPHVHFDTKAYSNIKLNADGRFLYYGEPETPTIKLLNETAEKTDAGICSYMWDSHFGYRVCDEVRKNVKLNNTSFDASFLFYSMSQGDAKFLRKISSSADYRDIKDMPFLEEGLNKFDKTPLKLPNPQQYWQFQKEIIGDRSCDAQLFIDRSNGYSDNNSLAIKTNYPLQARWIYTSFGPEFGGAELPRDKMIKVFCQGKILSGLSCFMSLSLRFRKTVNNKDENEFIVFSSEKTGTQDQWVSLEILTPKIDFDYDRLHLILELTGKGECRFDDLEFTILD